MNYSTLSFCSYSNTIRTNPQNYWVCSVNEDGSLDWSDHDSMTKDIDRAKVQELWSAGKINTANIRQYSKPEYMYLEMRKNAERNPASYKMSIDVAWEMHGTCLQHNR